MTRRTLALRCLRISRRLRQEAKSGTVDLSWIFPVYWNPGNLRKMRRSIAWLNAASRLTLVPKP